MSALPPKADIAEGDHHVRFVPKADILRCGKGTPLFDHLVGAGEQRLITSANLLAAQLGSRTELSPVTCFEFFISELTSNAWPNPRT